MQKLITILFFVIVSNMPMPVNGCCSLPKKIKERNLNKAFVQLYYNNDWDAIEMKVKAGHDIIALEYLGNNPDTEGDTDRYANICYPIIENCDSAGLARITSYNFDLTQICYDEKIYALNSYPPMGPTRLIHVKDELYPPLQVCENILKKHYCSDSACNKHLFAVQLADAYVAQHRELPKQYFAMRDLYFTHVLPLLNNHVPAAISPIVVMYLHKVSNTQSLSQ